MAGRRAVALSLELDGERSLVVEPDVGTAAWIDCAGHLPWGLSADQREDDARSLTWDWTRSRSSWASRGSRLEVTRRRAVRLALGEALRRLPRRHLGPDHPRHPRPVPAVEQALVGRGRLLLLDACAYRPDPGHRLRLSVAGADWPNTIAPPAPVTLTVHGGTLELPLWTDSGIAPPTFEPGADTSSRGRLRRHLGDHQGRAAAHHHRDAPHVVASYDVPHEGTALEDYRGEVGVDRRTFAQWATAETTYRLTWPDIEVRVVSTLRVDIGPDGYDVVIEADAYDDEEQVGHREWREYVPR